MDLLLFRSSLSDLLLHFSWTARKKPEKKKAPPERIEKEVMQEKSIVPMRCCVDCGVEVP